MNRWRELARRGRKAMGMPPAVVARRFAEAAARRLRRPRDYARPAMLNGRAVLRAAGASSIDVLWESRKRSPFFVDRRAQPTDAFTGRFPGGLAVVVEEAERLLAHRFDLLGSGPVTLPATLPWRTDFKTGREWPPQYCHAIEYAELDRPSDVKVPWELSRCQHFTTLGQAYWLTADDRFATEFVAEVSDWIRENPYAYTVNWACPMDVALRAISWIWGFHLMADAPSCSAERFRTDLLTSLFQHGDFVSRNVERSDVNGNHYLVDAVGLVFVGAFFHDTRQGRRWLETGRRIVVDEMFEQVSADGVDFEGSTAYHRLVLESFLTAYLLLDRAGVGVPAEARDRLERMCAFVAAYTKPDGRSPLVGDADDGRVQRLGTQPITDHRYLLSSAAPLFDRGDFKAAACRFWEESFWLLGVDAMMRFDALDGARAPDASQAFPAGGYYAMRGGGSHVFVDCAEVGMRGRGGHGHNDVLAFELFAGGINVVTDCGAYVYTASPEWRNRFRSTAFHNVVQVDDEELNRFISPTHLWGLQYDARPADITWRSGTEVDYLAASHTGYERLADPVRCRRQFLLDKTTGTLVVRDTLQSARRHRYAIRFHFDPSMRLAVHGSDVEASSGERRMWLQPQPPLTPLVEQAWVSPSYGVKVAAERAVFALERDGRVDLTWMFSPQRLTAADRAAYVAALFERAAGSYAAVK